ncbi:hypothetical protein N0Y54_01560 [Nostoc punctiforme UO1]|uniref:hypothetical protein n=1 Tax=Nostoc punctiforme TaxID=272131 RepID=UPI0030A7586C
MKAFSISPVVERSKSGSHLCISSNLIKVFLAYGLRATASITEAVNGRYRFRYGWKKQN